MKLEFRNDDNVMSSPKEPGSYFNGSDSIVLLRLPDIAELRQLWHEFDRELRSQLKDLLLKPYGEIVEKLGTLGFRVGNAEERSRLPFGMLAQNSVKSAHFTKSSLFQAAAALDLVPDLKPDGRQRMRLAKGEGSILDYVLALPTAAQEALIETIVDCHENLDEWMVVTQGSEVGWDDLRRQLEGSTDAAAFLGNLAEATERMMGEHGQRISRHAKPGERICFSPTWFSQYLAMRKVWLWPARYSSRMMYMYPSRFVPLVGRMSVGTDRRLF